MNFSKKRFLEFICHGAVIAGALAFFNPQTIVDKIIVIVVCAAVMAVVEVVIEFHLRSKEKKDSKPD